MEVAVSAADVPHLTTEQMVEVDRVMVDDYRIELVQMMENAGRNLAHLARMRFLDGDPRGKEVIVLVGTGGNGGGALVAARRLRTWGATVGLFATAPDAEFSPVPAHQLEILRRMNVPVRPGEGLTPDERPSLIVDGIIGYSLRGAPHGAAASMIRWANAVGVPILALDAPSGVDTATGTVFDPAIRATATMTLALPKQGLRMRGVREYVGALYLADISVPPELYASPGLGFDVEPLFARDDIIRVR